MNSQKLRLGLAMVAVGIAVISVLLAMTIPNRASNYMLTGILAESMLNVLALTLLRRN